MPLVNILGSKHLFRRWGLRVATITYNAPSFVNIIANGAFCKVFSASYRAAHNVYTIHYHDYNVMQLQSLFLVEITPRAQGNFIKASTPIISVYITFCSLDVAQAIPTVYIGSSHIWLTSCQCNALSCVNCEGVTSQLNREVKPRWTTSQLLHDIPCWWLFASFLNNSLSTLATASSRVLQDGRPNFCTLKFCLIQCLRASYKQLFTLVGEFPLMSSIIEMGRPRQPPRFSQLADSESHSLITTFQSSSSSEVTHSEMHTCYHCSTIILFNTTLTKRGVINSRENGFNICRHCNC